MIWVKNAQAWGQGTEAQRHRVGEAVEYPISNNGMSNVEGRTRMSDYFENLVVNWTGAAYDEAHEIAPCSDLGIGHSHAG